jgi:hypothetical protein
MGREDRFKLSESRERLMVVPPITNASKYPGPVLIIELVSCFPSNKTEFHM